MRRLLKFLVSTAFAMLITRSAGAAETVWLPSLDLTRMFTGWGKALKDRAVQGNPLSIAGGKLVSGGELVSGGKLVAVRFSLG
jgi:hypothetical protein